MIDLIPINSRWNTDKSQELKELGISTSDDYIFKQLYINRSNIDYIEEYQGVCCIGIGGTEFITDIKYSPTNIMKFNGK